jgi:antitoxin component of MazEF toxin-antitoxin module
MPRFIRSLQKHGDGVALVFDSTMLEALNITPNAPLEVTIENGVITITPAKTEISEAELVEKIAHLRPRYKTMLENLSK